MNRYITVFLFVFAFSCLNHLVYAQQKWDWHLSGGTIIDGTGSPRNKADILVREDSIGFIGQVDSDTIQVRNYVDISGKIVSPGFIDVHAHGNPLITPEFRNFLAMGVTTIVLGQDGSSPKVGSLKSWFAKIEETGPAVNIAVLSGHGSIRQKVGVEERPPTEQELRRMGKLLQSDLEAGAFGMSSGLEYVPGLYASREELKFMAKVTGKYGAIIMSHMRSEDDSKIEASLNELADQGAYTAVHASHLKVVYGKGEERASEILRQIQNYRERGLKFTADAYPYSASYTGIGIVFPDWAKTERAWKNAIEERPDILRRYLEKKVAQRNGPDAILFGSGTYAGQTLQEAAKQENRSPVDLLLEMGPGSASAAHFVMDQQLQDGIVTGHKVMISSDGSPSMRHPRGYGSFAKIIRYYVHEKKLLTLEEAIYKMSGLPARTLGIKNRGTLKEGNKADLLIFDPEKIQDKANFKNPHQLAKGFNWIMVNGKVAKDKEKFNKEGYGTVLRKKPVE
ncbi:MAG TPA: amidohydrolase family protein [Fodinibius sp.]|nr:amidohydrolase family protein [Fodinibius sp.]